MFIRVLRSRGTVQTFEKPIQDRSCRVGVSENDRFEISRRKFDFCCEREFSDFVMFPVSL
jgi:hypothetical protein